MNTVTPPAEPVEQDWREADAHALEREVVAFQNAIAHLENAEQIADKDGDVQLAAEIRAVCSLIRERRNRKAERAREIRGQ